jgi:DNA-directed RNA polymerase subunit omega
MAFPLEELIEYNDNMYEITSAIIKRSYQLAFIREPGSTEDDKIVSHAAEQVFGKDVSYRIGEQIQ